MVNGRYVDLVNGNYKPTNITGGAPLRVFGGARLRGNQSGAVVSGPLKNTW